MDPVLTELVKWLPALLAGLIPAAITFISLSNRQRASKIEAQEIVNEEFRKARNENARILKLFEDEKTAWRQAQVEYETERDRLNKLITENSDKLTKLEAALAENKALAEKVAIERDGAKTELANTRLELTNTRNDLEKRLADIQGILDNLKGDYDQMQRNYDEAKADRTRIEKAFQERVDKLETDLATAETRLADLERKLAATERERDGLKQKNVELEARVSELETERDGLQLQVNTLRTQLDELRNRAESTDKLTDAPMGAELPISEE